ncbi:MAG TPA: hypothetical protein VGS98_09080 [Thermoanaerobaculia bacterium]|nr:hypothetical protein [Thermoanaerobaculia bacterium]
MDSETAQDIKRHFDVVADGLRTGFAELRTEVGDLRTELRTEVGELRTEVGDLRTELRTEVGGLRAELRAEVGGLRAELRTEVGGLRNEIADVKRHADVIAEGLRSDIRTVAEGVAGLDEKFTLEFESVREEFREQIGEVKSLLRVSYGDLDRRVQSLEKNRPS